jgi:signal peptidase II
MTIGILIILGLVILDQVTKIMALSTLPINVYVPVIQNLFSWHYTLNDGMAFGWLGGRTWILIVFTFLGLGLMAYLMKDFNLKANRMYSISMLLIIGGTLGNFIDRLFRAGVVVDFLHLHIFPWTFNFADMYLTFGVILFAIDTLLIKKG